MKRGLKIFLAVVVLLVTIGLFLVSYYPERLQQMVVPEVEQLRSVKIKLKGDTLHATLNVLLRNKGLFKINIDSVQYKVNFDTLRVLSKSQDLSIALKAGQADTFDIPAALPYKRLSERIAELQERDSVDIKTDVRVVYHTLWGRTSFSHQKTTRIAMPRPPQVEVSDVRYAGFKNNILSLEADVTFKNKSEVEMRISDIVYRAVVHDLFVAEGKLKNTIEVTARSSVSEKIPVDVEIKKPLKTGFYILTGKESPYSFQLSCVVSAGESMENIELSVSKKGKVELKKPE